MGKVNVKQIDIDRLNYFDDTEVIQVVQEEQGDDNIQVMSYGMQVMIINDNCGNFMPVLGLSVSEMCYQYGQVAGVKTGKTHFSCSLSYFNALAGCWEPAIEKFNVTLKNMVGRDQRKNFEVTMEKEININLTESLLKTLKDAYDSFINANDTASEQAAQVF